MIFILVDIFIHLDKFLDVLGEDEIEWRTSIFTEQLLL